MITHTRKNSPEFNIMVEIFNIEPVYFDARGIQIISSCLLSPTRADIYMEALNRFETKLQIQGRQQR